MGLLHSSNIDIAIIRDPAKQKGEKKLKKVVRQ